MISITQVCNVGDKSIHRKGHAYFASVASSLAVVLLLGTPAFASAQSVNINDLNLAATTCLSPAPGTDTAVTQQACTSLIQTLVGIVNALKAQAQQNASCHITHSLAFGSSDSKTGGDVSRLQNYLISQGVLAAGNSTGYFGPLTEQAVRQWQAAHSIISYGSPATTGWGVVGPKTRATIAEACTPMVSPPTPDPTPPPTRRGGGGGGGGGGGSEPLSPPPPAISAFSQPVAIVGTSVAITGTGFTSSGNTINFGGDSIATADSSGTQISFSVPAKTPGEYPVTVSNANGTSNVTTFAVSNPDKQVLASWYGWWGTPSVSGDWRHWRTVNEAAHHIGSTVHYPLNGPYDSHDPALVHQQVALAKASGITGFIASWSGPKSFANPSLARLVAEADTSDFRVSAYVETFFNTEVDEGADPESVADTTTHATVGQAVDTIMYLLNTYANHPSWLTLRGKPVIFVYGRAMKQLSDDQWNQVAISVTARYMRGVALIGHGANDSIPALFAGKYAYNITSNTKWMTLPQITDWAATVFPHQVEGQSSKRQVSVVTIIPGYDDRNDDSMRLPPRPVTERYNGDTYRTLWQAAIAANPNWLLITSWNELHEGSEIEPTYEHGTLYTDITKQYASQFLRLTSSGPSVSLTQSLGTTTSGKPFTISWSSSNASSCTLQQQRPDGSVVTTWASGLSGSKTASITLVGTHHWRIDCTGADGTVHASIEHTVRAPFLAEEHSPQVTVPGTCNANVFSQVPRYKDYFVGPRKPTSECTPGTIGGNIALYKMDWSTNTLNVDSVIYKTPAAVSTGVATGSVGSAHDPTVVSYNGELWVAFECGHGTGFRGTSSCVGPFDLDKKVIDPDRTTVIVEGRDADNASIYGYSTSVPNLFVFNNRLYVYWAAIQSLKTTQDWQQITIRGMELTQEPSGLRRLWGVGSPGKMVASYDPSRNVEVLGLNPGNPYENQSVDLKGLYIKGAYIYLIASVGGKGPDGTQNCLKAIDPVLSTSYGCWRMQIFRSAVPLGTHIFNERVVSPLLPMNPASYQHPFIAPDGTLKIIGNFFNTTGSYTYPFNTLHFPTPPPNLLVTYPFNLSSFKFQ